MPNRPAVYWDSCVFIDRLQRRSDRIAVLESLTDAAGAGEFMIVTSVIAISEVVKLPRIGATPDDEARRIAAFFDHPWISVRIVDHTIASLAADLRRSHNLKTCDALHVATALRFKIPIFHTYDGLSGKSSGLLRFDRALGDPPLRIIEPAHPSGQPGLFPPGEM